MLRTCAILMCLFQLLQVSCEVQVPGCPDPLASNYNPGVTSDDGSCVYDPVSIKPEKSLELDKRVSATSGLIFWDELIWTMNDNGDTKLYGVDTSNAHIKKEYDLQGVVNINWEEIGQDEAYLFVGDFGNNYTGNRTDLHLLRIEKNSLLSGNPNIDTIWYSYSDQFDLEGGPANETDFDCEAFVVSEDSIYLFTKQWTGSQTGVYSLPKHPGVFIAQHINTYNVEGLITGSVYLESERILVLCGYTNLLFPFLHLCYDFEDQAFFEGKNRRVNLEIPFHQIEGITTLDGLNYFVSNELLSKQPFVHTPQQLHYFNLEDLLRSYLLK